MCFCVSLSLSFLELCVFVGPSLCVRGYLTALVYLSVRLFVRLYVIVCPSLCEFLPLLMCFCGTHGWAVLTHGSVSLFVCSVVPLSV